jgi:hypothetical protein
LAVGSRSRDTRTQRWSGRKGNSLSWRSGRSRGVYSSRPRGGRWAGWPWRWRHGCRLAGVLELVGAGRRPQRRSRLCKDAGRQGAEAAAALVGGRARLQPAGTQGAEAAAAPVGGRARPQGRRAQRRLGGRARAAAQERPRLRSAPRRSRRGGRDSGDRLTGRARAGLLSDSGDRRGGRDSGESPLARRDRARAIAPVTAWSLGG